MKIPIRLPVKLDDWWARKQVKFDVQNIIENRKKNKVDNKIENRTKQKRNKIKKGKIGAQVGDHTLKN